MSYIEGFVTPVPAANKEAYLDMAAKAWTLLQEFGAIRQCEYWGDDVPAGKNTDFMRAVQAEPHETVVFSWIEYPSKAVRDAANAKMRSDPRMAEMGRNMPFDGKRMVYGGFAQIYDQRA